MVHPTQHHYSVSRLQLRLYGGRLVGEDVVVPEVAAGDEARSAILTGGGRVCDKEADAQVSAEGVGGGVRLVVLIDYIIAVETLVTGTRADDKGLIVVQLGLGHAGGDFLAVLEWRMLVSGIRRRRVSRRHYPVVFQCAGEEIFSCFLPDGISHKVEGVSFRFA